MGAAVSRVRAALCWLWQRLRTDAPDWIPFE